jgi:heme/copper-type cytochrome/quinol oxidase subunit 3
MATHTDSQFHVHHDSPEQIGRRERLGVRLLIVADGAFVFGMIFSYFYLKNLNSNNGWIPVKGHTFTAVSGWWAIAPFVLVAIIHRIAVRNRSVFGLVSILAVLILAVGMYYQWHQMATMKFMHTNDAGDNVFEGAYASNWVLLAGANMFHYILTLFIALGLAIRYHRAHVNATLETWRQRTAGSWFTWTAISGIALALTTTFIR